MEPAMSTPPSRASKKFDKIAKTPQIGIRASRSYG